MLEYDVAGVKHIGTRQSCCWGGRLHDSPEPFYYRAAVALTSSSVQPIWRKVISEFVKWEC